MRFAVPNTGRRKAVNVNLWVKCVYLLVFSRRRSTWQPIPKFVNWDGEVVCFRKCCRSQLSVGTNAENAPMVEENFS